jgi:hypothetical protein
VLYNFKPNKSALDVRSVILDNTGGFYCTLVSGQSNGAIFQLKKMNGQWKQTIIFYFNLSDGSWPVSGLALDTFGIPPVRMPDLVGREDAAPNPFRKGPILRLSSTIREPTPLIV